LAKEQRRKKKSYEQTIQTNYTKQLKGKNGGRKKAPILGAGLLVNYIFGAAKLSFCLCRPACSL
jgi:hypothetical protein